MDVLQICEQSGSFLILFLAFFYTVSLSPCKRKCSKYLQHLWRYGQILWKILSS